MRIYLIYLVPTFLDPPGGAAAPETIHYTEISPPGAMPILALNRDGCPDVQMPVLLTNLDNLHRLPSCSPPEPWSHAAVQPSSPGSLQTCDADKCYT